MTNAIPPRFRTSSAHPAREASFPWSAGPMEVSERKGPAIESRRRTNSLKESGGPPRSPQDGQLFFRRLLRSLLRAHRRFLLRVRGRRHELDVRLCELHPGPGPARLEEPFPDARPERDFRADAA